MSQEDNSKETQSGVGSKVALGTIILAVIGLLTAAVNQGGVDLLKEIWNSGSQSSQVSTSTSLPDQTSTTESSVPSEPVPVLPSSSPTSSSADTLLSDSSLEENDGEGRLPAPSVVDEDVNLKFESQSCEKTGTTQVTCDVLITNLDAQNRQEIKFSITSDSVPNTDAIDSFGTVYPAQRAESGSGFSDAEEPNGSTCECFTINLASDIPTKITFVFEIPQEVTELAALDVGYLFPSSGTTRKTAIPKVGAIASR